MAKFYGNGAEFAAKGDKAAIPDNFQSSGAVSYETGYGGKYSLPILTDTTAKNVERTSFNQLLFQITEAIGVLQTQGMWGWLGGVNYKRGMQVLHNDDAWMCVNPNVNSEPNSNNTNWIRMVELFQQVGVTNTYFVSDGTQLSAPIKGSRVFISGYWKTDQFRVDSTATFNVAVNGIWKNMQKTGNRGGSKGHSYYSNNYFAFAHIFEVGFNKGDNISIQVAHDRIPEYELFLTFLG